MIHGIGTDLLDIDRIRSLYENHPDDAFFRLTFTRKERMLILSRPDPLYSYATRFAGKEAVFKALQIDSDMIRLNEIEILENKSGAPTVSLLGNARMIADRFSISKIHISLTYDIRYACAYAIAEV